MFYMKQKKWFFISVFLLLWCFSKLSAQYEFIYGQGGRGIWAHQAYFPRFEFHFPNRVEFHERLEATRTGTYSIDHEYGIPFINFYWDDGTSERYLMLSNEYFILLYNDNTEPVFFLHYVPINRMMPFQSSGLMVNVTASSSLVHGGIHFAATRDRLGTHINRVWAVEGGIGERLYVRISTLGFPIFISIGYVHHTRPYLFKANSRPKRIRILNANDETRFYELELVDTPNFQRISFNFSDLLFEGYDDRGWETHSWDIIIEILEVHPGFRYNHMCINSIISLGHR